QQCTLGNGQNYLRSAVGHAAVGEGGSHAKVILPLRIIGPDVKKAALLAVYAFREIKARVEGCGNATTAVCLKGNSAYYVPWYLIQKAEQLFDWYCVFRVMAISVPTGCRSLFGGSRNGDRHRRNRFVKPSS